MRIDSPLTQRQHDSLLAEIKELATMAARNRQLLGTRLQIRLACLAEWIDQAEHANAMMPQDRSES